MTGAERSPQGDDERVRAMLHPDWIAFCDQVGAEPTKADPASFKMFGPEGYTGPVLKGETWRDHDATNPRCARCGHRLSRHNTPGAECIAVTGVKDFCACTTFIARKTTEPTP